VTKAKFTRRTAEKTLGPIQKVLGWLLLAILLVGLIVDWVMVLKFLILPAMIFQLLFVSFKLYMGFLAGRYKMPQWLRFRDKNLPVYTTLHPMYGEANMIATVVESMEAMDYPKDKLQCILVLEERDRETVEAARSANLPDYFEIVEVPSIKPYGKPKACNVALEKLRGEFVVIFDAEDKPDPLQLRKAVGVFKSQPADVGCLQARLVFDNQETSWVSRFLGNEYTTHFEFTLAGMAHANLAPPLGGTSNHFPMEVLRKLAFDPEHLPAGAEGIGAWDPWNVTEDAELGGALAGNGYRTLIFDSYTNEEATLTVKTAFNQRTRWIKGYGQTALVLLRAPFTNALAMGPIRYLTFLLMVGGTFVSLLLAPIFWMMTILYFATRAQFIIELFPLPLYYTGLVLMILGNLLLFYQSQKAALHREVYSTVKYLPLTLAWWIVLSSAAYTALLELAFPKWRPAWNKTAHGVTFVPFHKKVLAKFSRREVGGIPEAHPVTVGSQVTS
jgi:cellulose synthase/poly-beta-1,6-N-acetylglucosamine synthase-like glycosyltransferase